MTTTTAKAKDTDGPDLEAIAADMTALKRDFEKLAGTLRKSGNGAARDAAQAIRDETAHLYEKVQEQGERSVQAVRTQVEERPITSLLIAFAIGFIGSRLLPR